MYSYVYTYNKWDVVLIIMSNLSKSQQGVWHKESGFAAGATGKTVFLEAVKKWFCLDVLIPF